MPTVKVGSLAERGRTMFQQLKFIHKLLLMPALAGLAFLLMLALVSSAGSSNDVLMGRIENGYFPALEVSRGLEEALTTIQRGFQDAVAASDVELAQSVDAVRDQVLALLRSARDNPVLDPETVASLDSAFQAYYGLARESTLSMIQQPGGDLLPQLEQMSSRYNGLKSRLAQFTQQQRDDVRAAFASARANGRRAVLRMMAVLLIALVALGILSLMVSRSLTRGLDQAVAVADRLAGGDMTAEIEVHSRDESGRLLLGMRQMVSYLRDMARVADAIAAGDLTAQVEPRSERDTFGKAFRTMSDNLRTMIGGVKSASMELLTSAEGMAGTTAQITAGAESQSSSTEETSSTMVEIASQIDSVARSTSALATNVEQTSASVEQMAARIEEAARNSDSLLAAVDETSATIEEMTASIRSIAEKVQVVDRVSSQAAHAAQEGGAELSRVITGIGSSSKDIGKIVRLIEEIADQTNLLALNAAIEAARAGEAGRGFAVVAEEVRRLAERSVGSTREISRFVETVQKDTEQAVDLTRSILHQIVESVTKTTGLIGEVSIATQEQSGGASQILRTSTNMQDVTRQLAQSSKQQALGAHEIMKAVESMNRMTQQVADASAEQKRGGDMVVKAMEQIAQVARHNLTASEQLSQATASLSGEANRLQRMAEVFRI